MRQKYVHSIVTHIGRQGKALYDGRKADVWAMGVLLCVMLIGKFPFEGDSISTMGVHDPLKKVWVQQNRTTWSHNTLLKDQLPYLSPEVRAWCACHSNTDAWFGERVTNRGMNDCGSLLLCSRRV
jgi:serine/threonine protein kinase